MSYVFFMGNEIPIHLRPKRTLAGAIAGDYESGGGETDLFHGDITFLRNDWMTGYCRYALKSLILRPIAVKSKQTRFELDIKLIPNLWNHKLIFY